MNVCYWAANTAFRANLVATFLFVTFGAQAQSCVNRSELDEPYCDANQDLLADRPKVSANPHKIVIGVSSVEDADTARRTYAPLMDHLAACLKKEVELYPPVREGTVLEGQRNGVVHIGQYSTGGTLYAVNFAGAIPFAGKGRDSVGHSDSYTLKLLVRADSPAKQPADLKGKKVAHTTQTSNSGNLAPRALFPALGLKPDADYKVEFSGGHDKSITGVKLGLYDAAAVASDVMDRMIAKGEIKASEFRVVYESEKFPTDAFAMSHNLEPALQAKISKCFADFRFPSSMSRALEGNNRFFPRDYRKDWGLVRLIAKESGNPPTKANYQKVLLKK
ncbi:MAG: phosphate/phosphite/phosphonate ABC transporter substrate-binding protein [Pseudomonadota bacterium]|nr:phosphate/phosphite/phosphonate ABC transporter substrate-binding protein [Pseudomonadota bacterium]